MEAAILFREPEVVPLRPGVFALVNRKRRFAYISYTINLQKRSHSISHMLLQQDADPSSYWPIKDLPKHKSDEFTFMVMHSRGVNPGNALAFIAAVSRQFVAKGYKLIEGHRAGSPDIRLGGKVMTLAEAVRDHSKVHYLTAYRRLERGWTVPQALGLEPPDPRWHKKKQTDRKERANARADAT